MRKDRVRAKLPELLVDGSLTVRSNYLEYLKIKYDLGKLEKRNGWVLHSVVDDLSSVLERLERMREALRVQ